MTDLSLADRSALPDALRVLLAEYPRDSWEQDPNFSSLIQFWLDRHVMFRRLLAQLETDVQNAIDGEIDQNHYARSLSRYGAMLVNELQMHHQIEDTHFFPVLARQDKRLTHGFDLLDKDHHAIAPLLQDFAKAANSILGAPDAAVGFTDKTAKVGAEISRMMPLLDRHLVDEEELVVPVLLKYRPAGIG